LDNFSPPSRAKNFARIIPNPFVLGNRGIQQTQPPPVCDRLWDSDSVEFRISFVLICGIITSLNHARSGEENYPSLLWMVFFLAPQCFLKTKENPLEFGVE